MNFVFSSLCSLVDTDGFLLLAGKDDEAQQYDSTEYQDCGKDGSQYAESDDDVLLGAQGVVLLLDGGQAFIVLLLQDVQFVLCGKRFHGVGPEDILVVGACHQSGIVCLAGNADESLVAFVYLGVVLLFLIICPIRRLVAASPCAFMPRCSNSWPAYKAGRCSESRCERLWRSLPVWSAVPWHVRDFSG